MTGSIADRPAGTADARRQPRVWLLMGYRAGESGQILALAEALGWSFEVKRLAYRKHELLTNLFRGTGLRGIIRQQSSALAPPWPDLVISAGMRNEPVARWIRRQAGGGARLVFIGRTWAPPQRFDLVITTPQYRLSPHPNVLHNQLTLHRVTAARLAEAQAAWAPRLTRLPRPFITVLVGGNSGPYVLDRQAAERLGRRAAAKAKAIGGSLLVTTSARTPRAAVAALTSAIDCPAEVFRWTPQAADNPYFGFLTLADELIVTGDSVGMLSEACATRKPVHIFVPDRCDCEVTAAGDTGRTVRDGARLGAWVYRQAMRFGPRRWTRDVGLIHHWLIAGGRAVWLGQPWPPGPPPAPPEDMARAVARVQALFETAAAPDPEQSMISRLALNRCGG